MLQRRDSGDHVDACDIGDDQHSALVRRLPYSQDADSAPDHVTPSHPSKPDRTDITA